MNDFVTALTTAITPAALWDTLGETAPLIAVVVLVALGYHVIRKAVKGVGRGKVNF